MEVTKMDLTPEGGPSGFLPLHGEAATQARSRSDHFRGLRGSAGTPNRTTGGRGTSSWGKVTFKSAGGAGGVASPVKRPWLTEGLSELYEIDVEADNAGDPRPETICKEHAERILQALANLDLVLPIPAIYPGKSGEVEISSQSRESKSGVLVSCEPQGFAACYVSVAGKTRRARYDDAGELPDSFLTNALAQLTSDQ